MQLLDWRAAGYSAQPQPLPAEAGLQQLGLPDLLEQPDMTWLPDCEQASADCSNSKRKAPVGEAHKKAQRKYRERQKASGPNLADLAAPKSCA